MSGDADAQRLQRVIALINKHVGDMRSLRVLDLACRVGVFSEGLASLGADVLGVEGRRENLDQVPEQHSANYILGDVRDLSSLCDQEFDVTLCLGILYHLRPEETLELLRQVRPLTKSILIIDTHLSTHPDTVVEIGEDHFQGHWYDEGDTSAPWSSIGNTASFWFAYTSLWNILDLTGWHLAELVAGKAYPDEPDDRHWYVAS